ncbi:MAG TPA: acyl-CoA dehydrogenase C-terminal domain-containing protein, partial [Steroidobacteraceae bacterium]
LEGRDAVMRVVKHASIEAVERLREATDSLLEAFAAGQERALAVGVPYLNLCGFVLGGWLMAKSAAIADLKRAASEREFYAAKLASTRFYAQQILPRALALARIVQSGAGSVTDSDAALI